MKMLKTLARETIGLFVEDEFLALAILAVVGITALIIQDTAIDAVSPALILLVGCLAVLIAGVWRTARSERS